MRSTKPIIGVTLSARSAWRIFPLMWLGLRLAGARAVKWVDADAVDIDAVDGVIIGGGDDISPELYGGEMVVTARLDPARDALERAVLRDAFARDLPVLGICRGAQMLNIVAGGSLDQDAYGTHQTRNVKTILPRKTVRIADGTRLGGLAGTGDMRVNALHSQAVDRVGIGLRVAARDSTGMIQAVERVRAPFALGVQWHPEHLFYMRRHRALFRGLVSAARARSENTGQMASVDAEIAGMAVD
ncbi:MAG: gamma-glutamyl-gamma-aminobutyrate hydrolase family protein [Pseudomonadota bacterium]